MKNLEFIADESNTNITKPEIVKARRDILTQEIVSLVDSYKKIVWPYRDTEITIDLEYEDTGTSEGSNGFYDILFKTTKIKKKIGDLTIEDALKMNEMLNSETRLPEYKPNTIPLAISPIIPIPNATGEKSTFDDLVFRLKWITEVPHYIEKIKQTAKEYVAAAEKLGIKVDKKEKLSNILSKLYHPLPKNSESRYLSREQ